MLQRASHFQIVTTIQSGQALHSTYGEGALDIPPVDVR